MGTVEFVILAFWVVAACLFGAAFTMIGPTAADYRRARLFFVLAGVLFGVTGIMWGVESTALTLARLVVVGGIGAIALIGTVESLRFLNERQHPTIPDTPDDLIEKEKDVKAIEKPEAVVEAERIFVGKEVTPRYLLNLYRDNSGIQADKLAKVYIGKWIELTDELGDVLSLDSGGAQVSFEPCADVTDWYCYTLTAMYFDKKWTDRLSILKPGAKITVIGQIRSIAATRLVLDNSELKS